MMCSSCFSSVLNSSFSVGAVIGPLLTTTGLALPAQRCERWAGPPLARIPSHFPPLYESPPGARTDSGGDAQPGAGGGVTLLQVQRQDKIGPQPEGHLG